MNGTAIDNALRNAIGARYLGVYAADEVAGVLSREMCNKQQQQQVRCFLANTDNSYEPGEHWVAFTLIGNTVLEFFDSYGFHPSLYFPNALPHTPLTIHFNNVKLQKLNSSVCAHYCFYYLYFRCLMHKSLNSIVTSLSIARTPHPDQSVKSFFIRIMNNK